jgi:peptidoglycan/LPS O-acetylase OafA/YrhL
VGYDGNLTPPLHRAFNPKLALFRKLQNLAVDAMHWNRNRCYPFPTLPLPVLTSANCQPIMPDPAEHPHTHHWIDAWHVNPSVNRDYDFIDGLRGIAILMVVFGHHIYVNPESGPVIQFIGALSEACTHGITLFFALSGFLISWPFWKRKFARQAQVVPPGYAGRRFWKIYPPLALSILIFTPLYILLNNDWSYLPLAAKWLVGLPFLVPVSGKFNPVMWTLVVEVQFYMVLPILFILLKKTSPKFCLLIITLLFLLVPTLMRAVTEFGAAYYPNIDPHFPSLLDVFCLGIWVAGLENMGVLKKGCARLGLIGCILWPLALLTNAWLHTHPQTNIFGLGETEWWMEKIASGCLLCYVANPQLLVARLLCAPWLRWCGIISYEWYLFHQPISLWTRKFFGPAGGVSYKYAAIVGGSFLFSLILAALIYRFFSLPILKYGRKAGK